MSRDAFVFYRSFYDVAAMLPTEQERTMMLLAIIRLGLEEKVDDRLPLEMRMALTQMAASIKGASDKHERAVQNGRKGGAPKGNKNAAKKKDDEKNNQNNLNRNSNSNTNKKSNTNTIPIVNDSNRLSPDMGIPEGTQSVDREEDDDVIWEDP